MRRSVRGKTASIVELQQMIADWAYEVDVNYGRGIEHYFTEDGIFLLGDFTYEGHAGIKKFYTDREANVRANGKGGERQVLHAMANFRISVADDDRSGTIDFFNVNYSADGVRPVPGGANPTIIAECKAECVRGADGEWRISMFKGTPVMFGDDPFLNSMLMKDAK